MIFSPSSLFIGVQKVCKREFFFLKEFSQEDEIAVLLSEYLEVAREIDRFFAWHATLSKEEQEFLRFRFWEGMTIKEVCAKMAISPAKAYKIQKEILKKWEVK